MDLQTLEIIATVAVVALVSAAFLLGRAAYKHGQRVRQRLQMGQIFTNITHELLTPLTVMSASVDHLREAMPAYEHDYELMELNIQRMVRLLQQILDTSKSQAGELRLKVANGDVMEYIHNTALCLEPLMAKKGLAFTINCQPASMMGWIDTDKLDKIIYNLLSNAAKYTEQGKVELLVWTSLKYDHIYIKVSDTGSGMSKDQMKHLFKRFYDGDYRKHQTIGNGIGLALTRDLVYLHHGTIECRSHEGEGTTFTVRLPITKDAFRPDQIDERQKINVEIPQNAIIDFNSVVPGINDDAFSASDGDDDSYRILIVEDNPELLMLMHHALMPTYRVFVAPNGKEALSILRKTRLDLIITDWMMPEMDGIELTMAIKGDDNYKHLPVMLLTAKTQEEDQQDALRVGADEYMTKPFRLRDLKLRIDNIIENRKRALQDYQQGAQQPDPVSEQPETPEQIFLAKARQCVIDHLDDTDYDRDTFAADMGASASTLYNKLRAMTGMNVSAYIRDIRLNEARRIAEATPGLRVSDLAYKVGFQDPKYFSTCFKKQFGLQPKEFMDKITRKDGN